MLSKEKIFILYVMLFELYQLLAPVTHLLLPPQPLVRLLLQLPLIQPPRLPQVIFIYFFYISFSYFILQNLFLLSPLHNFLQNPQVYNFLMSICPVRMIWKENWLLRKNGRPRSAGVNSCFWRSAPLKFFGVWKFFLLCYFSTVELQIVSESHRSDHEGLS